MKLSSMTMHSTRPAFIRTGAFALAAALSQATIARTHAAGASTPGPVVASQLTPVITWAVPTAITYGTKLSAAQLDAKSTTAGTFAYSPASGTTPHAGSQTLKVTFTPTNTTSYTSATASVTLTVKKATPVITWATPGAVCSGTAISSDQLDAVASFGGAPLAGTFNYSPASGTQLLAGKNTLTTTFTPTDSADFAAATASVPQFINLMPPAAISGNGTGLDTPTGLAVDSGFIYAANYGTGGNSVTVYPLTSSGSGAPSADISGANTQLKGPGGVAVNSTHIFVTNVNGASVTVYRITAGSNAVPSAVIKGAKTGFVTPARVAVDASRIYVTDSGTNSIDIFPLTAGGNVAPSVVITGSHTGLNKPSGIAVNAGHIYVCNGPANSILSFSLTASGNASPSAVIAGSKTGLDAPLGIAVDSGQIYVANEPNSSVTIYPLAANGNVSPIFSFVGSPASLQNPVGIAVNASNLFVSNATGSIEVYLLYQIPGITEALVANAGVPRAPSSPAPEPDAPPPVPAGKFSDAPGGASSSLPVVTDLARGEVSAESPLTGEFIVGGTAPRKVLVWVVGPSLDSVGVDDPLAALSLSVFDLSGTVVARSDASDALETAVAEAAAGVLPLPDGSLDSAVIATLPPGTYTAVASASGSASGIVLVEVYEIP
jgi:6-phosphogluconolactonase (cycloisomerase 2 family)